MRIVDLLLGTGAQERQLAQAVGRVRAGGLEVACSERTGLVLLDLDGKPVAEAELPADLSNKDLIARMGELLHGAKGRRLWLAGRAKLDDWGSRPQAELHLEDAAWAD